MRNFKICATLVLVVAIHAGLIKTSSATPININFTGPSQAFVGVTSVFGNLFASGSGIAESDSGPEPFKLTPPNAHPITLKGGFAAVSSEPASQGPTTVFDLTPTSIDNITNLNVDLLNGTIVPIVFNTVTLTSDSSVPLLQKITVDASVNADGLEFSQTGAATLAPLGPNFGTFSVPGDFAMHASNFNTKLFGLIDFPLGSLSETVAGVLSGTYSISGPNDNIKVTLDGTLALQVPINVSDDFALNLTLPPLSVNASAAAIATLLVNVGFHFEQDQIAVPEPGSIALLGVGLLMSTAFIWGRRRPTR